MSFLRNEPGIKRQAFRGEFWIGRPMHSSHCGQTSLQNFIEIFLFIVELISETLMMLSRYTRNRAPEPSL